MNIFQQITDYVKRDYSTFDMKNNWLGSINGFGSLNAIYHSTVLPGDTWKMSHNVMVKLPPLISPAFTRIKGIVNSYYCSYASVWNYWNSFISDKPEDVFLSRSLSSSYKGKFVEPCCRMTLIALICKFAYGYFDALPSSSTEIAFNYTTGSPNTLRIDFRPLYQAAPPSSTPAPVTPTTIIWGYNSAGLRYVTLAPTTSSYDTSGDQFWHDSVSNYLTFVDYGLNATETPFKLGFADFKSFFIHQCQECARNLSNHGVPVELIARTNLTFYAGDYFNLLPFIAESSIWHNFYRDEQNQSPEFDYREVNGCVCTPNAFYGQSDSSMVSGWSIRLLGIPLNGSTNSSYWFRLYSSTYVTSRVFSLFTGFQLEEMVRESVIGGSGTDISVLPKFYNGLLCLKYRNFEKDYFTSACVDPNYGGVSVAVPNTIDALRTASKLEEFLEVSASARDFYNFMKHIFGTNPESTRYNKPLLLGTQVIPIQIGEQLQTSQTTTGVGGSPLGDRAGVADGYGNSGTVNHYFNEHGIVVSFLSFVIDSQYMQGMPHEFNHHLQLDYPFPQFANLGAETIPTKEIYYSNQAVGIPYSYADGDNNAVVDHTTFVQNRVDSITSYGIPSGSVMIGDDIGYIQSTSTPQVTDLGVGDKQPCTIAPYSVFGYTPRYSKWKFKQDVVAGQLRDDLEYWHTFRHFTSTPFISNAFVSYMNAGYLSNLNRIFAVDNDNADKFVCDIFNNASVRRCLPLVPQTTMD